MSHLENVDRKRAVSERGRNLVVDASAGTGKTSLVVDRLIELVAPSDGGDPIAIERLAAITFTRKAAGELRVRVRHQLLETLAALPPNARRSDPLLRALGLIDTAHIGTIHGFADRLLRKWPAQARLDPQYQLTEDPNPLLDECFETLIHGAETATLADLLRGTEAFERADEASETVVEAQRAGVRLRSLETEHWTYHGLDGLASGFILHRDVDPGDPASATFDRGAFDRHADELISLTTGLSTETRGGVWLTAIGDLLRTLRAEPDPVVLFHELVDRLERGPRGRASDAPTQRHEFSSDARAWDVWKAFAGDDRREPVRSAPLRDDLLAPLRRWMALRLARLRPVVLALYERVKARHQVVDHVDLLLHLRNLLRDDRAIRLACQQLFDHIFVDEFQDTDPLQAEIVMYLCERGTHAARWDAVELVPGKLTIVGDPKQSIYRFRRADIRTYQRVLEIVERSPHLSLRLSSSFRSSPGLVDWINHRFDDILGAASSGARFHPEHGEVFHQRLTAGRESGIGPHVHAVAMESLDERDAAASRLFEAETMARYLRWLVEISGISIEDPVTREARTIRYGDIGVLALTTTNLPVLFEACNRDGVPYAARGGTLFLSDKLQRTFLLGLCAVADRDDGVALAALLRPPFFAVDLGDLARARADVPSDRASQARDVVRELRRRRFERSPGQTARALLEETAIGRVVALGPNGSQRLGALRELCFQVEVRALRDGLDFDGVMEQLRGWVDAPQGLDRPQPVGSDAIRAITVHQAKGLEFPVVVLWDTRATWAERTTYDAWTVERDGHGWALRLDRVKWEEPAGAEISDREREMRKAERKRLVYVAATRARDLLVIPKLGAPEPRWILGRLLGEERSLQVLEQPVHARQAHASWFDAAAPPSRSGLPPTTERDVEVRAGWQTAAAAVTRDHLRATAFTDAANPRMLWGKKGRFGTRFGETVHLAIGFALRATGDPSAATARASRRTGLTDRLTAAEEDVARALRTLETLGVTSPFELEYPVTGIGTGSVLVSGYIDLLATIGSETVVLDFKTDEPPTPSDGVPERYANQVRGYANVLASALQTNIRAGLLYTADGSVHWLSIGDNARS